MLGMLPPVASSLADTNAIYLSRLLLDSVAEGIFGVDTQGNCTFANAACLRMLGFQSADELVGKRIHEVIHHSYADGSPYPAEKCLMSQSFRNNENIHVSDEVFWRRDGSSFPVEYWCYPIMDDGQVTGALATFFDITERKQAEQRLQEMAEHTQSLLRLSKQLECAKTYTDVLNAAHEALKSVSDYQHLWVYLFTEDKKYAKVFIAGGSVSDALLSEVPTLTIKGDRFLEELVEAKEIVVIEDAQTDDRTNKEIVAQLGNRTIINVPIYLFGQSLGVVGTGTFGSEGVRIPTQSEREFMSAMASHLAVTLDRLHWITENKQAEAAISNASKRLQIALEGSQISVWELDTRTNEVWLDAGWSKYLGNPPAESRISVTQLLDMVHPDDRPRVLEFSEQCLKGEIDRYVVEHRVMSESGQWVWILCRGQVIERDSSGRALRVSGTNTNITDRKLAEDEIQNLAFYDSLTRLPNRRLLMDRLHQARASCARSSKKGALLFIDLDNFKILNDTLGHDIGDLLLKQVAQRLESCVREGDTVSRLGGDEFVVMLEDLSEYVPEAATQTKAVGEKIITVLNQPYQLGIHTSRSTPSIGATLFAHDESIDELLKQADIAMYQSKKAGRNTLRFFDQEMQDAINSRAQLEGELRTALENNQFQLHYQIQVDNTLHVIGVEALLRWAHPARGMIPPSAFIPLAEETDLILSLGDWVLHTACAQIKSWSHNPATRHLRVAVNVSPVQFAQDGFVERVKHALDESGIDPDCLKLELTESMMLNNVDDAIAKMQQIREFGVGFSMDDFGTGFSSLSYLKKLPLDQLKIDQSFIRDLVLDPNDKAIVEAIITMGGAFGLSIIAEGVETEAQRSLLFQNGCNTFQGYLFGKPVPIDQLNAVLRSVSGCPREVKTRPRLN
jgi:diguanylate cyclase (GGDEF)-like protein/PAS domain S-box-containing protein